MIFFLFKYLKKYMLCKKFYNLVYFTTTTLYKSKQMSCDNSVDLRLQTLHDWVKLHIIKIILLILENIFQFFRLSKIKSWVNVLHKKIVQVNLCQKLLFLHQLTHNMMTYSLNYKFSTWKLQAQNIHAKNMLWTCCVHKLFWTSKQKQKTICIHNMFWACSFHVLNW